MPCLKCQWSGSKQFYVRLNATESGNRSFLIKRWQLRLLWFQPQPWPLNRRSAPRCSGRLESECLTPSTCAVFTKVPPGVRYPSFFRNTHRVQRSPPRLDPRQHYERFSIQRARMFFMVVWRDLKCSSVNSFWRVVKTLCLLLTFMYPSSQYRVDK